ncbi:MAG: hypothetical protein GX958_01235 [Desulfitobacterium sp.]|nr:hypothetical protein [Desulfitobacterium sp.]
MYLIIYAIFNLLMIYFLVSYEDLYYHLTLIIVIVGLLLFILDVKKFKRLKAESGETLFQFEKARKASPILYWFEYACLFLIMALIFVVIYIKNEGMRVYFLLYSAIHEIYLESTLYPTFTEKGLFYRGKLIHWQRILSYKWEKPYCSYPKGYSLLVLEIECKHWLDKI